MPSTPRPSVGRRQTGQDDGPSPVTIGFQEALIRRRRPGTRRSHRASRVCSNRNYEWNWATSTVNSSVSTITMTIQPVYRTGSPAAVDWWAGCLLRIGWQAPPDFSRTHGPAKRIRRRPAQAGPDGTRASRAPPSSACFQVISWLPSAILNASPTKLYIQCR